MAKVTIDGEEFDTENFSEEAKGALSSLQYVRTEKVRLEAQMAVLKTAEVAYTKALKEQLS